MTYSLNLEEQNERNLKSKTNTTETTSVLNKNPKQAEKRTSAGILEMKLTAINTEPDRMTFVSNL